MEDLRSAYLHRRSLQFCLPTYMQVQYYKGADRGVAHPVQKTKQAELKLVDKLTRRHNPVEGVVFHK